jgi:hypothetical protein
VIKNVWTKSSRSSSTGSCVEVRWSEDGHVQVRDSKNPDGPMLTFSLARWSAFMDETKYGAFDLKH